MHPSPVKRDATRLPSSSPPSQYREEYEAWLQMTPEQAQYTLDQWSAKKAEDMAWERDRVLALHYMATEADERRKEEDEMEFEHLVEIAERTPSPPPLPLLSEEEDLVARSSDCPGCSQEISDQFLHECETDLLQKCQCGLLSNCQYCEDAVVPDSQPPVPLISSPTLPSPTPSICKGFQHQTHFAFPATSEQKSSEGSPCQESDWETKSPDGLVDSTWSRSPNQVLTGRTKTLLRYVTDMTSSTTFRESSILMESIISIVSSIMAKAEKEISRTSTNSVWVTQGGIRVKLALERCTEIFSAFREHRITHMTTSQSMVRLSHPTASDLSQRDLTSLAMIYGNQVSHLKAKQSFTTILSGIVPEILYFSTVKSSRTGTKSGVTIRTPRKCRPSRKTAYLSTGNAILRRGNGSWTASRTPSRELSPCPGASPIPWSPRKKTKPISKLDLRKSVVDRSL